MFRPLFQHLRQLPPIARFFRFSAHVVRETRYRLGSDPRQGEVTWVWKERPAAASGFVEARFEAGVGPEAATEWCRRQTLLDLWAVGLDHRGETAWHADRGGPLDSPPAPDPEWLCFPDPAVTLRPDAWESCRAVAAAEEVDGVLLRPEGGQPARAAADVLSPPRLRHVLLRKERVGILEDGRPVLAEPFLVKELADHPLSGTADGPFRRGAYLSSRRLPARLEVGVRTARRPALRRERARGRTPMLVLVPFFARGGAEHTLYETLAHLRDRYVYTFVSLAPHRPELGDRREDFRRLGRRLLSLGDWVHPAAMPGILDPLLHTTGARILYNANGTTLFYDFVPKIRTSHPDLLIVDHLYDHEIGYIDRYGPELLASVDLCVAENHRIRDTLAREKGWPEERAPVVWPCGRPVEAFPAPEVRDEVRRRLRSELGIEEDHLVVLTAARMHPQKRPIDLVRLAERLRGEPVCFLLVGGGDLQDEVDHALAQAPDAPILRLGFRTDIPDLIAAADVGCLVSEYEGLPVFLLECLQAGRPFLGTAVGEMGRVIRETGAGLVVEQPGDLDALEAAVRSLLRPEERSILAGRAETAGRRFDVASCAERYHEVFASGRDEP